MRLASGLFFLIGGAAASAQPCLPVQEYDEILAVVTENFFDQTFNGLDWETQVATHRREVDCEDGPEQLASVVNSLLEKLDASHTALYTKSEQHYWGLNSFFWRSGAYSRGDLGDAYQLHYSGIWAEFIDGTWFAQFVLDDSSAENAGVLPGDELIAINGSDFHPLGFSAGNNVLTVSSDGVSTRDVRLSTAFQSIALGLENASQASSRILTADGRRVGYFHVWAGGAAIREIMERALGDFESAEVDALIMDLRGGYGGMGEDYLDKLRESARLRAIPKYFLIDDSLRSGKELLAGAIKRDGIGTLVGATTAGQFLGGRRFSVAEDNYFLYVAIGNGRPPPSIPGIGQIEGNGISADIDVARCRMYCAGSDPIFEKALDLIAN